MLCMACSGHRTLPDLYADRRKVASAPSSLQPVLTRLPVVLSKIQFGDSINMLNKIPAALL